MFPLLAIALFSQGKELPNLPSKQLSTKITSVKPCTDRPNTLSTWLEYMFIDNTLYLHHVNAHFECALHDYFVEAKLSGSDLIVKELGKQESISGCGCYVDLTYRIDGIKPGIYKIIVNPDHDPLYPNTVICLLELHESATGAIRLDNMPLVPRVPSFQIK
jgi:hypothetical protein